MKIGGLQKVSLIDYPGKISAILFTRGCNFRCGYCHNPELVEPRLYQACLPQKDVMDFLKTRKGKLDAVTITGGEPTIQEDLISVVREIRKMGFALKLDSNGSRPDVLESLLRKRLIDYIALDIKAPYDKYSDVAGAKVDIDLVRESLRLVIHAGIQHEFRTTVVASLLSPDDIDAMAQAIVGAKRYVLQKFQPARTLVEKFSLDQTYSDEVFLRLGKKLEKKIPCVVVR